MDVQRSRIKGLFIYLAQNLIAQTREKQAATLSEVTWRGRTVPVKFEKVRLFLTNVKEAEKTLDSDTYSRSRFTMYEKLLMECKDALQVLRDELKNDPSFTRRGGAVDAGVQISSLHYLHSYLSWIRADKTIGRNLLLIANMHSG